MGLSQNAPQAFLAGVSQDSGKFLRNSDSWDVRGVKQFVKAGGYEPLIEGAKPDVKGGNETPGFALTAVRRFAISPTARQSELAAQTLRASRRFESDLQPILLWRRLVFSHFSR